MSARASGTKAAARAFYAPKSTARTKRTLFQEVLDLASIKFFDGNVLVGLSRSRSRGRGRSRGRLHGRLSSVGATRSFALCAPRIARERRHGLLPPALFVGRVGARVAVAPSSLRSRPATAHVCQKMKLATRLSMQAYRFSPAPLIVGGVRKRWGAEGER